MTKWKNVLRSKGIKMECDYPMIPFNDIQGVYPGVFRDGIYVTTIHASIVFTTVFNRDGSEQSFDDIMLKK